MHPMIGWGITVVVFAALLNGSFTAPIKKMSGWQWENTWLLFAFSGLLVLPWILTLATVPNLEEVFREHRLPPWFESRCSEWHGVWAQPCSASASLA